MQSNIIYIDLMKLKDSIYINSIKCAKSQFVMLSDVGSYY